MSNTLNSHTIFQAQEGNSIWKLLCSPEGILAGEERNSHTREASFFGYDLKAGGPLWSGLALEDKWWLNIVEVTKTSLFIQHYAEGPLPTPSGVTSIDLISGTVRWTLPRVSYFAELDDEVILLQQGMLQGQYIAVDSTAGEMTRRVSSGEVPSRNSDEFAHLTFPAIIDVQETESGEVQRVLDLLVQSSELRGLIEYLKLRDLIILSYYSRDTKDAQSMLENKLVQDLAIVNASTLEVIFRERLSTTANYPVSGAYFLFQDQLLYVKDGSELKSITLA